MRKVEWRTSEGKYAYGVTGYLGMIKVAEVTNPTQSKAYEGPRWRANVFLPGISVRAGLLNETQEGAQGVAERVISLWFERIET